MLREWKDEDRLHWAGVIAEIGKSEFEKSQPLYTLYLLVTCKGSKEALSKFNQWKKRQEQIALKSSSALKAMEESDGYVEEDGKISSW